MSLASGLGEQQPWRLLLHGGDAGSGRSSLAVGVWRTDPVGGGRHRRLVSPLTPPPRPPCQGAADLSPGHGRLLPTWGGDLARPPLPYGRRVEAGSCAWRPTPSPRRPRAPPPPSQGMAAVVNGGHHLFLHDFVCPPPRCDPPGAVLVRPPRCGST
jgi:hypothetical protein